jgi:anti-sigma regulatory factor (Ser/Thr protein kinase)
LSSAVVRTGREFAHEALLYDGEERFVAGVAPFIREGAAHGEPVLVVVAARKIDLLREALGGEDGRVLFVDMADVGANPARIIPVWQDFVAGHVAPGRRARGVGEPIWHGRGADELVECQRHEALLNLAFARSPAWRLLCPYDTRTLDPAVIEEALRSHPVVVQNGQPRASDRYAGLEELCAPFVDPLADPPGAVHELAFDADSLADVRRLVYWRAAAAGLGVLRTNDLVLAVNEILTNSVRHGGGAGLLRIWQDGDALVCEVRDRGRIEDPLADRRKPGAEQTGGRGLWMANQLCDLVQIRSLADGNVVRLSMRRS